jgi:hypothetical protein
MPSSGAQWARSGRAVGAPGPPKSIAPLGLRSGRGDAPTIRPGCAPSAGSMLCNGRGDHAGAYASVLRI